MYPDTEYQKIDHQQLLAELKQDLKSKNITLTLSEDGIKNLETDLTKWIQKIKINSNEEYFYDFFEHYVAFLSEVYIQKYGGELVGVKSYYNMEGMKIENYEILPFGIRCKNGKIISEYVAHLRDSLHFHLFDSYPPLILLTSPYASIISETTE